MKPPMPYSGGKQTIAEQIVDVLPPHSHYVEPFCGAMSVLLAKTPSKIETVNDINGDLVAFWRVLRDRPAELERVCALTPHSREEFVASHERDGLDDLERARRVWVNLSQSRGSQLRRSGWRFVHGTNRMALSRYLSGYVARIAPAAERLHGVSIEQRDAIDCIEAYGRSDACLYVDPPYLGETRYGDQYEHEFASRADHELLLAALLATPAAVVLSGYAHPLYDEALTAWHRVEMSATNVNGARRTEVVWTNYEPHPTLLTSEATA